jgi:ankyrin repeat protein
MTENSRLAIIRPLEVANQIRNSTNIKKGAVMSAKSLQSIFSFIFIFTILSGCGGAGIKSTSTENATTASTTEGKSSVAKTSEPRFGQLKKRNVPYRPNSNPVTNKAFAENLMAARAKEAERFLKQGADADTVLANGEPVLYTALRMGLKDVADSLVLYGADVNAATRAGRTPLLIAIDKGNEDFVQLLLENGADANQSSNSGETPLMTAIARNQTGIVNRLLNYKADPNISGRGESPLQAVLKNGNVEIAELLASNGANVNVSDSIGESILHKAAARGQVGFARVIIANGANVNAKDQYKETPLHEAAAKGRLEMVKLLLAKGAYLYAKTEKDWTALHGAARFGHPETAAYLISRGLSRNESNSDGKTPRGLARHLKHDEVIKVLK